MRKFIKTNTLWHIGWFIGLYVAWNLIQVGLGHLFLPIQNRPDIKIHVPVLFIPSGEDPFYPPNAPPYSSIVGELMVFFLLLSVFVVIFADSVFERRIANIFIGFLCVDRFLITVINHNKLTTSEYVIYILMILTMLLMVGNRERLPNQ